MTLKCISLHEPWASAVALKLKPVETRSRPTNYRGTLGIHAAKKWSDEQAEALIRFRSFSRARRAFDHMGSGIVPANTPELCMFKFGHVIALVDLYEVKPTDKYCGTDDLVRALGDFSPGRYAWLLRNIRRLIRPIPCRGAQGFFHVQVTEKQLEVFGPNLKL